MRDIHGFILRRPSWVLLLPLLACGGGSSGGSNGGPSGPSVPTYTQLVTVFYDENGNGLLDPVEGVRLPGVEVVIGAGSGTTAPGTGQAAVTGILEGSHQVTVNPASLPAYFQAAPPIPVAAPGSGEVFYPVSLPIGNNNANRYLGYGDSITAGEGSGDGNGYVLKLQDRLGPYLGRAEVIEWGRSGDSSIENAEVATKTLRWFNPAYTLILLGTNDWHDSRCQDQGPSACFTIEALRSIVLDVKAWQSLPVLGTLPPVNPALAPAGRNAWVDEMNGAIRALAQEQGVPLADINGAFKAQGSLPPLFTDDVHPSDMGYEMIAQAWFEAITRARAASSARGRFEFSFGG
jgi:lysophospholipase L1-like esterase